MQAGIFTVLVRLRRVDDFPSRCMCAAGECIELGAVRQIAQRQIDLALDARRLVAPRSHAAVYPDPYRRGDSAEHDRNAIGVREDLNFLRTIEESAEPGHRLA